LRKQDERHWAEIEQHMEVDRSPDMTSFQAAMAPVFQKYESQFGKELIEAIQAEGM